MYVVNITYDGDTEEWEYLRNNSVGGHFDTGRVTRGQTGRGLGALQRALEQDTVGAGGQFWNGIREEVRVGGRARKATHPDSSGE